VFAGPPKDISGAFREEALPRPVIGGSDLSETSMADEATHALSPAAAKPAHVPDSLVYDFDLFADPALLADPHARILDLLKTAPLIFWSPRGGGGWTFISHEANFEASRDWDSFTSEFIPRAQLDAMIASLPPGTPHIPIAFPINLDPPDHGKYRLPLNAVFSPKAMNNLKGDIRALAQRLIADVRAAGRCEFMSAVAEPLPVQVFLKLLGLPLERQAEYRLLVQEFLAGINDPDLMGTVRRQQKVAAAMRETFLERKANPKDDLISLLWKTEIDGKPVDMDDMENYGVLLFIAGLDTVMNGMGFGVRHLAADLELQDRLRQNAGLAAEVTEELLRRYTFTVPPRKVAKDLEFQGVRMKQGERVNLLLPAADLDARRFAEPERFDLGREDKVHIAFNAGPHRCLGSHLARIELQILYEEIVAGLPQFRLDPDKPPRFHGGHVIGVDHLNLVWDV
jgi:cytochrome P450